jgi:type IV pilus assembly protein PilW
MTRINHLPGARRNQGFSLIELMVSLTIGLIIAIAGFAAYLGIASASKMAEAQGRMNEDAQAALIILTQQLRMAGSNPDKTNRVDNSNPTLSSRRNPSYLPTPTYAGYALQPTTFTLSSFTIRGCDGAFSNIQAATDIDHLTCGSGINTLPDSIAVSYEADIFNTIPTAPTIPATTRFPTDCLGKQLTTITATLPTVVAGVSTPTDVTYAFVDNRFYIGLYASIPSLYCKGNGLNSTAQPLVENVEDLQFIYGITAVGPTVAGYLRADQLLSNAYLSLLPDDAARWGKVVTVRICVLVRSASPVVSDAMSARYNKCDGTLEAAPPDLRLRRAYSATVVLRNRRL